MNPPEEVCIIICKSCMHMYISIYMWEKERDPVKTIWTSCPPSTKDKLDDIIHVVPCHVSTVQSCSHASSHAPIAQLPMSTLEPGRHGDVDEAKISRVGIIKNVHWTIKQWNSMSYFGWFHPRFWWFHWYQGWTMKQWDLWPPSAGCWACPVKHGWAEALDIHMYIYTYMYVYIYISQ